VYQKTYKPDRAFLDFAATALEKLDAVKLGIAQGRSKKR